MISPYSVQVAAWQDDDGDWYETGLHIFCKSFVFYCPNDNMYVGLEVKILVDGSILVDRDPVKTSLEKSTLGWVYH